MDLTHKTAQELTDLYHSNHCSDVIEEVWLEIKERLRVYDKWKTKLKE